MNKNQLLIPSLRFKGFDGDWNTKAIKDIALKLKSGGTPKSDNKEYYNGKIPFALISDFNNKYLYKTQKFISNIGLQNSTSYIVDKGNILLSIYATIGKVVINNIDVAIPQSILGIFLNLKEVSIEFFYQLLLFNRKNLIMMQETGTQPNLNLKNISNFQITFPSILEQQKIAKFFSLLDKQIELWERKVQLWEQIYRYYLNKFIPNIRKSYSTNNKLKLGTLLIEKNEKVLGKNISLASVGKLGFKLRKDLFKHDLKYKDDYLVKIVNKNNVVIGMGANQIDFKVSRFSDLVGVSYAYKVYDVLKINPIYLELFIERNINYFSKSYMIVSARQGKTIDINSFMKDEIIIIENENKLVLIFDKIDKFKKNAKKIIMNLNNQKKYYLKKMFV